MAELTHHARRSVRFGVPSLFSGLWSYTPSDFRTMELLAAAPIWRWQQLELTHDKDYCRSDPLNPRCILGRHRRRHLLPALKIFEYLASEAPI